MGRHSLLSQKAIAGRKRIYQACSPGSLKDITRNCFPNHQLIAPDLQPSVILTLLMQSILYTLHQKAQWGKLSLYVHFL
jgi:hypothetical protein